MSEGLAIALITAVMTVLSAFIGAFATIIAAEKKNKDSNSNQSTATTIGAVGLVAALFAVIGLVIGLFGGTFFVQEIAQPQPTESNTPVLLPSTVTPSLYQFTDSDIDNIIGRGYWRCIDGSPRAISIEQVPLNYTVAFPFTRIDTGGVFYQIGEQVSGGGLGTGWLVSELPNSSCSPEKPIVNSQIIDNLLGQGKWKCVGENQPSGADLAVVPSNFMVQRPINFVDSNAQRYYQGESVPEGVFARIWFGNDIPQNECP